MQLAVLCVLFAHLCLVTATPHGYGVKGGAAAKAVAGAAAGAYSGIAGLPPGILGDGFSGSYTKSSSSSSASSSASSSSSSFTFSGSGYPGVPGGCATGICPNNGVQNKSPYSNAGENSGTLNGNLNTNYNNGFPNTGAYSGAVAQAGAIAGSQIHLGSQNNPSCTGNNCFGKEQGCKGSYCNSGTTPEKKCESGQCFPLPSTIPTSVNNKDNENNCASGKCDSSSEPGSVSNDKNHSPNNCQSGQCEPTTPQKCSTGQCASSSTLPNIPSAFQSNSSPHSKGPITGTTSTTVSSQPSNQGYNSNPHLHSPLQGPATYENKPLKCTSGQCKPSSSYDATYAGPNSDDIAVNVQKNSNTKLNSNSESNDYEQADGNNKRPSDCVYGNCGSNPSSPSNYPSNHPSSINVISKCSTPDCRNNVYNHATAATGAGALAGAYNKPATYLTTPKQEPSCTTANCKPANFVPGQHTSGLNIPVSVSQPNIPYDNKKPFDCASGHCGANQPYPSYPTSNINAPAPVLPNLEYGITGHKCTSPNCASTPQQSPYQNPHSYYNLGQPNVVNDMNSDYGTTGYKCTSPNCASTPQQPSYQNPHSHNLVQPSVGNDKPSYNPSTPAQGQFSAPINNPTLKPSNYQQGSSHSSPGTNNIPGYQPNPSHGSFPTPTYPNQVNPDETKAPKDEEAFPEFVPLRPQSPQSCGGSPCSGVLPTKPNYGTNTIATQTNIYTGLLSSPSFSSFIQPSSAPSISTSPVVPLVHAPAIKPGHDNRDKPAYIGGFGGPAGLLKPNDYSLSSAVPSIHAPGTVVQSSVVQPSTCSTGKCNSPVSHDQIHHGNSNAVPAVVQNGPACTTDKCGSQNGIGANHFNGAHASAGATASANAIVYTGGFGGPPGFLKPYDNGDVKGLLTSLDGKNTLSSTGSGGSPVIGVHSSYNHGVGSGAQAFAAAGATAGAFGGQPDHYGHDGSGNKAGGGCGGGCSHTGSDSNGGGLNSHYGRSELGLAKAGSISGANAGGFGFGGSFASSSASAHASAGAAVKGYGRR